MARGKGESPTSPRRIEAVEKRRKAIELRKAGATFQDIADAVGYSGPGAAHKAVKVALDEMIREPTLDLINLELMRLDALLMTLFPQALKGSLGAVDRVLRIMERRAKLLGMDAPTQVSFTWESEILELIEKGWVTPDEVREELGDDLVRELFESAGISFVENGETEAEGGEKAISPAEDISE
jgi:hypothetical protein